MSSPHSDSRTKIGEHHHPVSPSAQALAIPAVLLVTRASLAAAGRPAATALEVGVPAARLARTGETFAPPNNAEARLAAESRVVMANRGAAARATDAARQPRAGIIAEPMLLLLVASGFFLVSRSIRGRVGRGWLSIRADRTPLRRP